MKRLSPSTESEPDARLGAARRERGHSVFAVWVVLAVLLVGYIGGYLVRGTQVQVNYGNPSGLLLMFYEHTWEGALFKPIELSDRWMFSGRWKYDEQQHNQR